MITLIRKLKEIDEELKIEWWITLRNPDQRFTVHLYPIRFIGALFSFRILRKIWKLLGENKQINT